MTAPVHPPRAGAIGASSRLGLVALALFWATATLCGSVLFGCGASAVSADHAVTVISLRRLDCTTCGAELASALRQKPGVYDVRFEPAKAELHVTASRGFDAFAEARRLAANEGFEAVLGAGLGEVLPSLDFPEGADVQIIHVADAPSFHIDEVLVPGRVTVVDFSATWCKPCRQIDAFMAERLADDETLAYRKLDIGSWDSETARAYLGDVPALPYCLVFDAYGERQAAVQGTDTDALAAAIEQAHEASYDPARD